MRRHSAPSVGYSIQQTGPKETPDSPAQLYVCRALRFLLGLDPGEDIGEWSNAKADEVIK